MLKPLGGKKNRKHTNPKSFLLKAEYLSTGKKGRIMHLQFSVPFGKQGTPLWFDNLTQDEIILTSKKVTSPAMMSSP